MAADTTTPTGLRPDNQRKVMPRPLSVDYLRLVFSTKDRRPLFRSQKPSCELFQNDLWEPPKHHVEWDLFGIEAEPRWGCGVLRLSFPRVARSSQPWALRRNPVGIPGQVNGDASVIDSARLIETSQRIEQILELR